VRESANRLHCGAVYLYVGRTVIRVSLNSHELSADDLAQESGKILVPGADPALREVMTGIGNPELVRRCAGLDSGRPDTPAAAAAYTLRLPARRIIELTREVDDLNQHFAETRAPADAGKRRSCGDGAKGPRMFDWAVAELPAYSDTTPPGWGRWLPARR
jgi:hypothetical protein